MKKEGTGRGHRPIKILFVDDEPAQRRLGQSILQAPAYDFVEVSNGLDALEAIHANDFDVVLLDRRMPGLHGDEVSRRVRVDLNKPLLPIIVLTAETTENDLTRSLGAGANDFIRKPYSPVELKARVNAAVSLKRATDSLVSAETVMCALARVVEAKDSCTGDHCTRLARSAVAFGRSLGLNPDQMNALERGGVMHDIGKLGIPDHILTKPGPLTESEWEIMRQHPVIGARLCSGMKCLELTCDIILHHHERWDGSGYPDGLAGEKIPLLARVFQIVDIYDALTSERPYKPAYSLKETVAVFRDYREKGWLDPRLVDRFMDILENRPAILEQEQIDEDVLGVKVFKDIVATGAFDVGQFRRDLEGTGLRSV